MKNLKEVANYIELESDKKLKKTKEKDESSLDFFDLSSAGSLVEDVKKFEIVLNEVPDIEVREVIIKETGNFLNLKDNIINIPLEMLIFPFFTPQKQNKRINFQYKFEDMGVTMMSTLIAKNATDKVFQPSIFEEKIYTYLISMYEAQKDDIESDEYIDFEISNFIENFLGNKMNRTYYTKVEQALKNLKNTEYQFTVSNHSKLGKYKFEDEEFKLLTYQKLKTGKKVYYRVTLNKNIRKKIKEKRYVKYNSKTLVEIMNLDPIASRIYKYISQMRFEQNMNRINIRTLAAIIPLKTEQITERSGKEGIIKKYILCRMKQVLGRIQKAFDVLKNLGYIEFYTDEYDKLINTYFITYKFNKEKDGTCHISTYLENKPITQLGKKNINVNLKTLDKNKNTQLEEKFSEVKKPIKTIVKTNSKAIEIKKKSTLDFSDEVLSKVIKVKKNIYVSKSWDKRAENKIYKIEKEYGVEFTKKLLINIYKNLNAPIKATLVQYINGVLNNMEFENKGGVKQKTLFGTVDNGNLNKLTKTGIKRAGKTFNKSIVPLAPLVVKNIKELVGENSDKNLISTYDQLDEFEKLKIEEKAIKLCCKETGMTEKILLTMKSKLKPAYTNAIKIYIERAIKGES
ncbi:MAG: replication initiator protein A [Fusobacteriaceae bacterium]